MMNYIRSIACLLIITSGVFGFEKIPGGLKHQDYSVSIGHETTRNLLDRYGRVINQVSTWDTYKSDSNGNIYLKPNDKYEIKLSSNKSFKTDARIEIDGVYVGFFRVDPFNHINIERSIYNSDRFVLPYEGSKIKVTFCPELIKKMPAPKFDFEKKYELHYRSKNNILSSKSDQNFIFLKKIPHDYDNAVTIYLKLLSTKKMESPSYDYHQNVETPSFDFHRNQIKTNRIPTPSFK